MTGMPVRLIQWSLNNRLLRQLVSHQDAWELMTYDENDEAPIAFVRTAPASS